MMEQFRVDAIINKLREAYPMYGYCKTEIMTFESIISELCPVSRRIFLKEPNLLHLQPPITIAGDFRGRYTRLRSVLEHGGLPPQSKYLFLGNYVGYFNGQGDFLRAILLLLALKIRYPENVFLLKGHLDDAGVRPPYIDEVEEQEAIIKSSSVQILNDCLTSLPVAALISDKIICTHSGLSPRLHDLDQIMHIKRYTNLPNSSLLSDLLRKHPRRSGDILVAKEAKFLKKHDLRLVCCGRGHHQAVSKYKDFAEHRVAVLSSACGWVEFHNISRVDANTAMHVDVNLMCSFHELLGCKRVLWSYHILMAGTNQHECSSGVNLAFRTTTNTRHSMQRFLGAKESGSGTGGTERDSKSVTKSSGFGFDPASLYRSESPGVKRFLGAKV